MTPSPVTARPRHQVWPWIVGLALAPLLVLGGSTWRTLHVSREAAVLRRQIMAATGGGWHPKIQFTVDRTVLGAVRGSLALFKNVPEEALEALAAVRSASIGISERADPNAPLLRGSLLAEADSAMALAGWQRALGVVATGETVLIYLPAGAGNAEPSRFCLAVCNRRELVVVAADIDAHRLARLAFQNNFRPGHGQW